MLSPYGAPAEASARFCPCCYRDGDTTCSIQAHWPEVKVHDPLYLSGVDCAATRAMEEAGLGVGLMLQPGSGLAGRADDYRWRAAENGCFSQGAAFDVSAWFSWLASLPDVGRRRRCLFAVAPDVLDDAATTWQRSRPWLELVRGLGHVAAPTPYPAAPVVSQLTLLPIEEVSAGTVRHGDPDATPSSSGQEGVDSAGQVWPLTGPWGAAAAGLPMQVNVPST